MKKKPLQVLLVEDNPGDARLYQEFLRESGPVQFELENVKRLKTGLEHLAQAKPDAILLDLGLPDSQGLETFIKVHAQAPDVPIVILTGLDDAEKAIEAVKAGAQDYLVKGEVSGGLLVRAISYAIERKRTEEALHDSEERWRSLVKATPDYIALHDPEGRYLFLNHYAEGFTEADIIGSNLYQYLLPESVELFRSNMEKTINTWTPQHFEHDALGDGGARRTYDEYLVPLRGKNQEITILAVARDISERKQTEAALKQSEVKFRQLIESSVAGIYIIQDAKMAYVNPNFAKAFGYSPEEIIGRLSPKDLIHPDDIQDVMRRLEERIEGETEEGSIAYKAIKKDGSIIYIEVYGTMIDFQGRPAVMGTLMDITSRKRAEDTLRESDSRYHLIFENSGTANTIFDKECRVMLQNSMSQKLTEPMDARGKTALEIFGPDQGPIVTERMQRVLTSGVPEVFETKLTMHGGSGWFRSSYFPLYKEQHELVGIQVISQDITEKKQMEDALRESEERYRSLIENATIGIYRTTPEGQITTANPALVRMLGFQSFEELAQRDLSKEGYEPAYPRQDFQKHIEQEGKIIGIESAWKRKDGSTIFVRESANLVRDENDRPLFYEGTVEDITERKQAEDNLDEERNLLRTLIDNLPDRVYVMDVQGRKTISNVADWQASGGKKMEDVIGKTDLETYPPELAKEYWALDKKVIDSGIPIINREEPGLDSQGKPAWVLSSKVPLRDGQGQVLGLVGIGRDITERKQVEEKLSASESELRALFTAMTDVVIVYGADGRYLRIAPTNPINLYRPQDDMLGKTVYEILPKEQADFFIAKIREAIQTNQVVLSEYALQINGKDRWFASSVSRLTENTAIWVAHDITERKQTQILQEAVYRIAAAAETTGSLDELYAQIHQIISSVMPAENFFITLYDEAQDLLRFPYFKDAADEPFMGGVQPGKGLTAYVLRTGKTLLGTQAVHDELERQGEVILLGVPCAIWLGVPLIVEGKTIGAMVVQHYSDPKAYGEREQHMLEFVSTQVAIAINRKRADEEIHKLNAELELRVEERTRELHEAQEQLVRKEKLAVLGQLAGGVGHELRNPLSVINTSIYYLKLVQPEADEKIKQHHAMIEHEVHNADKIIGDLLDFARVVSAEKEQVSVPELVQKVLDRFPASASVKITLDLPADLPQVLADGRQMEQVLGNLVVNACQAMISHTGTLSQNSAIGKPEGGKLTISASVKNDLASAPPGADIAAPRGCSANGGMLPDGSASRMPPRLVAIAVKDTGTGIAPENMKKLFEPLFTTKAKGIGLGLAVSKKLAEANGGRIEVESEVGKGSTFTLYLCAYNG